MAQLFVVMGVSGSGKTTVGQALAARLGCPFYDGDDFHPPANVAKMASGTPLNDADRAPWLARLAELLKNHQERGETVVTEAKFLAQVNFSNPTKAQEVVLNLDDRLHTSQDRILSTLAATF